MTPPDSELVQRVRQGDLDAYGLLMTRYRHRFGRYACHLLGNESDAEEALQDAFTLAYRAMAQCRDPERFAAWLFRILVNRCRTLGARRRRQESRYAPLEAAAAVGVAHPADGDMTREEVLRGLAHLVPEQREAFLLKYVEELSYEEIASVVGCPEGTARTRVFHGMRELRSLLGKDEP